MGYCMLFSELVSQSLWHSLSYNFSGFGVKHFAPRTPSFHDQHISLAWLQEWEIKPEFRHEQAAKPSKMEEPHICLHFNSLGVILSHCRNTGKMRYKQDFIFLSLSLEENMDIIPLRINNPTANLPTPEDSLLKLVKGCRRCTDCLIRVISTGLLLLKRGSITLLSPMILKYNILPYSYLPTYSIYIK